MVYILFDFSPWPSSSFFSFVSVVCVFFLDFRWQLCAVHGRMNRIISRLARRTQTHIHISVNVIRFVVAFVLIACSSFLFRFLFPFTFCLTSIHLTTWLFIFRSARFYERAFSRLHPEQQKRRKEKKMKKNETKWTERNVCIYICRITEKTYQTSNTYRTQHSQASASGQKWKKVILNWYFGRKFRRRRCHCFCCCRVRIKKNSLRTHYLWCVLLRINFLREKQENQKTSMGYVGMAPLHILPGWCPIHFAKLFRSNGLFQFQWSRKIRKVKSISVVLSRFVLLATYTCRCMCVLCLFYWYSIILFLAECL